MLILDELTGWHKLMQARTILKSADALVHEISLSDGYRIALDAPQCLRLLRKGKIRLCDLL
jgi:hypothetical protein